MATRLYFFLISLQLVCISVLTADSENASMATTEGICESLVGGHVSVITGDFVDTCVDFILPGPEPVILSRHYTSCPSNSFDSASLEKSLFSRWRWNHAPPIERSRKNSGLYPAGGVIMHFNSPHATKKNPYPAYLNSLHGATNVSSGQMDASTNPKNFNLIFDKHDATLTHPSGSFHHYKENYSYSYRDNNSYSPQSKKKYILFETHHIRADGSRINYEYKDRALKTIVALSKDNSLIASLKFDYDHKKPKKKEGEYSNTVEASNGQKCTFTYYGSKKGEFNHSKVTYTHKPEIEYNYYAATQVRKQTPIEKYLISEKRWGDKKHFLKVSYIQKKGINHHKVSALFAPWGPAGEEIPFMTFQYAHNYTAVFDAMGRRKHYHFNKDDRLERIVRFSGPDQTKTFSCENFVWGVNNEEGLLIGRNFQDADGNIYTTQVYKYDGKGNVVEEWLKGNLSGKSDTEGYAVRRKFDNSLFSNLLEVWEDNGRYTAHTYEGNTNRVTGRYSYFNDKVVKREFTEYDQKTTAVTKIIVDDGIRLEKNLLQGVTERHITYFTNRKIEPVGLPEKIEKWALDLKTGQEVFISKSIKTYLKTGQVESETVYDQNDHPRYKLEWKYNEHGLEIYHKNALGHETLKWYDVNDRLIREQGPSFNYHTEYEYDLADRLTSIRQIHGNGKVFRTSHKYNEVGNKVLTIDPMGNETKYVYDEFNQLVKTIYSDGADTRSVYNPAGHAVQTIDELGYQTNIQYNLRGKPIHIVYPDGTQEKFEYYLDGSLKESFSTTGLVSKFTWDYNDRILEKEEYSSEGQLLTKIINKYNAFHLLETTDLEGRSKKYHYDLCGRLIKEESPLYETRYEYDELSRLVKTIKGDQVSVQVYDLAGRVIEERLESLSGEVFTSSRAAYNSIGQRTRHWSANGALTQTFYNPNGQPILVIDPLDQKTYIEYDYNPNLTITTTDSLGQKTIQSFNDRGRVISIEKRNSFGIILSKQEVEYDAKGQKVLIKDSVIARGELIRQSIHKLSYNCMGQIEKWIEGAGEINQKVTRHRYNILGQKSETIKPNNDSLFYTYNSHGALKEFTSSDRSFHHRYSYNSRLLPELIEDLILKTDNRLEYNEEGQVVYEKLNNGLEMHYVYEPLGQVSQIRLPDDSTIDYQYSAFSIKEVSRGNVKHTYDKFNELGLLTESTLANGQKLSYKYDKLGRILSVESPYHSEKEFTYNSEGHLTHFSKIDSSGPVENNYTYDDLYQLASERDHHYTHDSINNRMSKDNVDYHINALNQISQQGDTNYQYDLNGNLTQKQVNEQTTFYVYDVLDRLIQVENSEGVFKYTYDSFNRRMTAGDKKFIYQSQNEIGLVENGSIKELRLLGMGKGAEIGAGVALLLNNELHVPIHDHNGHVICTVHNEQASTIRYTAFGEEEISDSASPWRFASKRVDAETGFVYFGNRFYDPTIGRWVTPDPIGLEDGPNLYAFLHNDPLLSSDLYGLYVDRDKPGADARLGEGSAQGNWITRDQERSEFASEMNANYAENQRINQNLRSSCSLTKNWGPHNPSYLEYSPSLFSMERSQSSDQKDNSWLSMGREFKDGLKNYGVLGSLCNYALDNPIETAVTAAMLHPAVGAACQVYTGARVGYSMYKAYRVGKSAVEVANVVKKTAKPIPLRIIREWIASLPYKTNAQICEELKSWFPSLVMHSSPSRGHISFTKLGPNGTYRNFNIKIHKAESTTTYNHIHIVTKRGKYLNADCKMLMKRSSDDHLPIHKDWSNDF